MVLPFAGLCKTCCFTRGSGIFSHKKGRITMLYEGGACSTFPSLERRTICQVGWWKVECCIWIRRKVCHVMLLVFYQSGYLQNPHTHLKVSERFLRICHVDGKARTRKLPWSNSRRLRAEGRYLLEPEKARWCSLAEVWIVWCLFFCMFADLPQSLSSVFNPIFIFRTSR